MLGVVLRSAALASEENEGFVSRTLGENFDPYALILMGIILAQIPALLQPHLAQWDTKRIINTLLPFTRQIPFTFRKKLADENRKKIKLKVFKIPEKRDLVQAEGKLRFKALGKYKPENSSGIYDDDPAIDKFVRSARRQAQFINVNHDSWVEIATMEAEVISMCNDLLRGDAGNSGLVSGNSGLSILEACSAYVLSARNTGIKTPEIIVPSSVHPMFGIYAQVLGARLISVNVDALSGAADVVAMKNKISANTCLMVGSAPSFACGVIDPIAALAKVAKERNIGLHVDASAGGFITPFLDRPDGNDFAACDFSVPGVSSISLSSMTGAGVLIFHKDVKATTVNVQLDSAVGAYVAQGLDVLRTGSGVAALWGLLSVMSKDLFANLANETLKLRKEIETAIKAEIPDISIPGQQKLSVICMQPKIKIDCADVVAFMKQRSFAFQELKGGFQIELLGMEARSAGYAARFVATLGEAVRHAKDCVKTKTEEQRKIRRQSILGLITDDVKSYSSAAWSRIWAVVPTIAIPGVSDLLSALKPNKPEMKK